MDLRGMQLRDAYQNLTTLGSNGELEDGEGNGIPSIVGSAYRYSLEITVPSGDDMVIQIPGGRPFLIHVISPVSSRSALIAGREVSGSLDLTVLYESAVTISSANRNIIVSNSANEMVCHVLSDNSVPDISLTTQTP